MSARRDDGLHEADARKVEEIGRRPWWSRIPIWFAVVVVAYLAWLVAGAAGAVSEKWFAVGNRLLTSGVASFLFYFLAVRLPRDYHRRLVRANLLAQYLDLKRDVADAIAGMADTDIDPDALMEPRGFRAAFADGDHGVVAALGGAGRPYRVVVSALRLMGQQIRDALGQLRVRDAELFAQVKDLELALLLHADGTPGPDEARDLWEFVASLFEGDDGRDRVEARLREI